MLLPTNFDLWTYVAPILMKTNTHDDDTGGAYATPANPWST